MKAIIISSLLFIFGVNLTFGDWVVTNVEMNKEYINNAELLLSLELKMEGSGFMRFNHIGFIRGINLQIKNSSGKLLPYKLSRKKQGPPTLPDFSKLYQIKAEEKIKIQYDLGEIFKFSEEGIYTVEIHYGKGIKIKKKFEVLGYIERGKVKIREFCSDVPFMSLMATGLDARPVECVLSWGKTKNSEKQRGFVLVKKIKVSSKTWDRSFKQLCLKVPVGTIVEKSALDFRWQLWTILNSNNRRTLILWNLATGSTKTIIPWGDKAIELGTTLANDNVPVKAVISGVKDKTKYTSLQKLF